jgi:hypothetical protein
MIGIFWLNKGSDKNFLTEISISAKKVELALSFLGKVLNPVQR